MSKMNGAQSLINALEAAGVDVMFAYQAAQFFLLTIQFLIQRSAIY